MNEIDPILAAKTEKVDKVILRSYPKIVFFYPLFFASIVLWIIQLFFSEPLTILGYIWLIIFAANIFVMAFDFNSTKFFILILVIAVAIILILFLVPWSELDFVDFDPFQYHVGINAYFYFSTIVILGLILLFVVIVQHFDYWKVERNELYHKTGIFANAERFPVKNLIYNKKIPDIFEFLALRAGSITLHPTNREVIHLSTVLNINKKAEQLDYLLSLLEVEIDDLDA